MPKPPRSRSVVAYVPVLHEGYIRFFKQSAAPELYIVGSELLKKLDYLRKDLRALKPSMAASLIAKAELFDDVKVLRARAIAGLDQPNRLLLMPDEDISREVAKSFKRAAVEFFPVFLRWDRRAVAKTHLVAKGVKRSASPRHQKLILEAYQSADKSSDIWRRVGAILVDKTGKQLGKAYNLAEPSAHTPWLEGDPRNLFNQGSAIETSLFTHAEAALIADAAKRGKKLEGASIYTTTFPCPVCARLIGRSGIRRLYFAEGYGLLDGQRLMTQYGVELIKVDVKPPQVDSHGLVPYVKT